MPDDRHAPMSDHEHTRLVKALRESELLRELAELLASSLDPTRILHVLVKRTTEVCEVERCAVWLLDEERACLMPSAYHVSTQRVKRNIIQIADHMWHHSTLSSDNPIFHRLLEAKGLLVVEDLRTEPSMSKIAEKFFVRSVLLIGLLREGRPVGMMSLDKPNQTGPFSDEQQQLARAIGQQAAVAIDNARLYQQAQQEHQRTQRLIERARATYQVATAVNAGKELAEVLSLAAQSLMHNASAQSVAITPLMRDTLTINNTTLLPAAPHALPESAITPSISALPHCYSTTKQGHPLFVPWEQLGETEQQWFQQLGMRHVLIVPLMIGSQEQQERKQGRQAPFGTKHCVGFVFLHYAQPTPVPGRGKHAFAQDIATQCALAIEKAHILNETHHAITLATERANTLDAIFNAMTEGIIVLDLEGRVITNNSTAVRFVSIVPNVKKHLGTYLKYHPAFTLYGQPIPLEDYPLMRALRGERIRGERFLSKQSDGSEHAIEVNIAPLFDSEQTQIGIVSAFRDITEQVRVEQRIRRALDTMLHAAEVVSGITDMRTIAYHILAMTLTALNCERGVVLRYNAEEQTFTPLLSIGFSFEGVDQWLAEQLYWADPTALTYAEFYVQLLAGHATLVTTESEKETETLTPGTMILAAPITHNNHLLGVMLLDRTFAPTRTRSRQRDEAPSLPVNEFNAWDMAVVEGIAQFAGLAIEQTRWQQEAEIARLNEETMRESNELKDEFLAITAHEFRTPLTVILAHSQMMGRVLQKTPNVASDLKGRLDESRSFIEAQARQLTNIVNTFLEVTRLNRGQIVLSREEIDLEEMVKEAIAHYSATSTNHDLRVCVQPGKHPYLISGDKARIWQVLANLLQNAIKYSPLGGPISITLAQRAGTTGADEIEVCVEDRGIGIPPEAQPHLFERFYRVHGTGGGTSQGRGIGLGLYVVAEFLRLHDGTIRVESTGIEGEGSRFLFTLPLALKADHTI